MAWSKVKRLRVERAEDGIVYFNDGRKVSAHTATGTTGSGMPFTPTHVRLAKAFLESQGALSSGK